jgi:hypothetical protein
MLTPWSRRGGIYTSVEYGNTKTRYWLLLFPAIWLLLSWQSIRTWKKVKHPFTATILYPLLKWSIVKHALLLVCGHRCCVLQLKVRIICGISFIIRYRPTLRPQWDRPRGLRVCGPRFPNRYWFMYLVLLWSAVGELRQFTGWACCLIDYSDPPFLMQLQPL